MSPGLRAAAELARDPRRADALVALAARCTTRTVQRQRRALERRGTIARIPSGQRQHAWAAWPSRNPGATARALAQLALDPHRSNQAIAAAAACTPQTVRLAAGSLGLAHTVSMGVNRGSADDRHAARAMTEAATRAPPRYAIPPDPIEDTCPGCTLIWDQGWQHDPACIFARHREHG
jgi:hypothetical protein